MEIFNCSMIINIIISRLGPIGENDMFTKHLTSTNAPLKIGHVKFKTIRNKTYSTKFNNSLMVFSHEMGIRLTTASRTFKLFLIVIKSLIWNYEKTVTKIYFDSCHVLLKQENRIGISAIGAHAMPCKSVILINRIEQYNLLDDFKYQSDSDCIFISCLILSTCMCMIASILFCNIGFLCSKTG